jgi:protein-disulfide isomerase
VITRREFVAGASALAIAAALSTGAELSLMTPAFAQATPSNADLTQAGPLGEMAIGKDDAPVTIIEYASMTCPHCATFHNKTYPEMKKRYVDTGKVRYILREFPFDPLSAGAFMLARCAGKDSKDRYFALVETLFQQQARWADPNVKNPADPLFAIVRQAGFTKESFESCLRDQKLLDGIEWVRDRGAKSLGVQSTPTFFINGKQFRGALSIEDLEKAIEPLLKS